MNYDAWTQEDAANFARFIRERGGHIVKHGLTPNGGWDGTIATPLDAEHGWGQQQLAEFEKVRVSLRQQEVQA